MSKKKKIRLAETPTPVSPPVEGSIADRVETVLRQGESDKAPEALDRVVLAGRQLADMGLLKVCADKCHVEFTDAGNMLASLLARTLPSLMVQNMVSDASDQAKELHKSVIDKESH